MGFSDTATYLRADASSSIETALSPLLEQLGFFASPETSADDFIASYDEPQKLNRLVIWAKKAAPNWWRLYSNAPGLFTWHNGDDIPFLQRLAKNGSTRGFEICVNDGDSICVMETTGDGYRLTGAHSYVLDDLYEQDETMSFTPGSVFPLKGVRLAYTSLEVDATLIDELIGYDFGFDMQEAIAEFEAARFGSTLESYYDASRDDFDARWFYKRRD
jgi:hypothetical protein